MNSQLIELGRRAASPPTQQTRDIARLHLFDALVAACAARATPEAGFVASHLEALRPGAGQISPADLVLALARRIRATELDDLQLESVTTAAAAVVPALVGAAAVAGSSELSADTVLDAVATGYDVMWTLGLAAGGPDFLYRQGGWPSLTAAGPAAAATTARLLDLDSEEIAHAIALAVLSTPRSVRGNGEDGRWLAFGLAVTAGFQAALAARSGARGDLSLLEQASGRGTPGRELFPGLLSVLERPWAPGHGLARAHLKQWASAGQVAAAIHATGILQDAHGFTAPEVTAVDVHVPPAYRGMIDQPNGAGRMWSLVSAQYQVAARLLHPQDLFDCARRVTRDDPGFRRLMGVIRVHEEESLAARHPQTYPARVTVTLGGGHVVEHLSAGHSPSPRWDWDSLLVKARAVAAQSATGQRIDPLRDAMAGFSDSTEFLHAAMTAVLSSEAAVAVGRQGLEP